MTKRMFIMIGAVLVLIAVLAFGKYLQIKQLIANSPKPGAQTVTAIKAEVSEWQPQLSSVGTLVPVRGVDVTSEIAGLVRQVHFKSGDEVKAGQLLFEMNADADIAQLRALQAAADLSASVLKRDKLQFAAQAISQAQLDNDEADLKSRKALAAQQQAVVDKKTIRAPFAGKLGITAVNPGQYLNPGDKLVTLQTIDTVYVDFFVPQKQLAGLSIGQKLNLSADAYPGVAFPGKVTSISPKVDAATRNVQVEATVPNAKRQLLPGMFANVSLDQGDKKKYLTLPQTAITYNPYGSTVFVLAPPPANAKDTLKDDKGNAHLVAQQVFVTTGPTRGDQVAILTGLKEGQTVVTSGQLKLKNGTPAVIDNKVQPANNPNPTPQEH
ncbi:efflux RND transporter periplasmic adaptor subunit [Duganella sp. BJB488]|uniref:efflux RND transporter periplasmic adaptor subunit n=1 Tax=unclassified Duganella TaxID=2636909 RepID=UPI000E34D72F|nr:MULTISPECIES: efflux RND transporter periplasmic adaptor subunit [unclassified Duganella]NVD69944.1 efflux RND transporter periplasmic adaptor subunit [Duganella sp. BJB1802]RFP12261.1 efflux RND transporter periplasmic adaptor subunit [Duganella sp. BJB488]RFP20098.1 efflux RND transporter periplasmic adaptor subunit [Duganella sp. BJB489]RFP33595.1 efflux RND transporter periplasmic adaptor subunit [Duganella sp. BJB480]